jgi:hypothetical protein
MAYGQYFQWDNSCQYMQLCLDWIILEKTGLHCITIRKYY